MSIDNTSPEASPASNDPFAYLHSYQFALLKTFRKTGVAVGTPIWFANENGKIYFTTSVETGKVKRIRNNGRATLTPADRRGNVVAGVQEVEGIARILPESEFQHVKGLLQRKYKFMYTLLNIFGSIARRNSTYIEITPR